MLNSEGKYFLNPKSCPQCSNVLPYSKRYNKFCDSSCAATYNNLHSEDSRKRGPESKFSHLPKVERSREAARLRRWTSNIVGPYSKLIKSSCSVCNHIILSSSYKKFCNDHQDQYSHAQRAKYWFTFSLSDYPDLFDFSLLKRHGMRNQNNPNGVVRDHKISVAEAIKNKYDPFYIKHPLNCELMLHSDNCKKNTKCSLTYNELKILVDNYLLKNAK